MKVQKVLTCIVPVCAATMLFTACDRDRNMGNAPVGVERSTGQKVDDKQIATRVKDALDENVAYKFPDVKVNTYNGKVQLSGFVATREQKQQAEDVANRMVGSANVENKISVKP
jgi:hyperosmotically inducible periplasmic protein